MAASGRTPAVLPAWSPHRRSGDSAGERIHVSAISQKLFRVPPRMAFPNDRVECDHQKSIAFGQHGKWCNKFE